MIASADSYQAVDRQSRVRNGRLIQVNAAPPTGAEVSCLLKEKADVLRQSELTPTDDAPTSGRYELLNVFGTATGERCVSGRVRDYPRRHSAIHGGW
jgi:hypothetical protein